MKYIVLIIYLIFSITSFCQTEDIVGDYELIYKGNKGERLEYKLSLDSDGTFFFHSFRHILTYPEENSYGKGTWKADKNIVYFFTEGETGLTEKYNLDFNNSKARFITKPPRDKTDRVIETHLRFYKSELRWISGLKLPKVE